MDQQITLSGFELPEQKEFQYLNSILTDMAKSISHQGGDPALLTFRATKSEGKSANSGYTTVSFGTFTVFRIHLRGNQHYLSIPVTFSDLIPPHFHDHVFFLVPCESRYILFFVSFKKYSLRITGTAIWYLLWSCIHCSSFFIFVSCCFKSPYISSILSM